MSRVIFAVLGLSIFAVGCNGNPQINYINNPIVINPNPIHPGPVPTICPVWGCNVPEPIIGQPIPLSGSGSVASAEEGNIKDPLLMRAQAQHDEFDSHVQSLASTYSMNIDAARQLVTLGESIRDMTAGGQSLTPEDITAINSGALNIVGVSSDEVTDALSQSARGDNTGVDNLISRASIELGMTPDVFRDSFMPSFGITTN